MAVATRRDIYRITGIRPWASEGTTGVPQVLRIEGKDVSIDELRALATSFEAEFADAVEGAARYQATIRWTDASHCQPG
jgi:hypothetical protein